MQKLVIRDRKGFTLLELLVVITILAILATVAIPYFQKEIGNARNSTRIADITTLSNKLSQADAGVPLNLTLISKEFQNGIPVDPKNKFGYQFNVSLIGYSPSNYTVGGTDYVVCTNQPIENADLVKDDQSKFMFGKFGSEDDVATQLNAKVKLAGYYCRGSMSDVGVLMPQSATKPNGSTETLHSSSTKNEGEGLSITQSCARKELDYKGAGGNKWPTFSDGEGAVQSAKYIAADQVGSPCFPSFDAREGKQPWQTK